MMTNILSRCPNYFGHLLKVVMRSKNKKVINFAIHRCNNRFVISLRNISSAIEMQECTNEETLLNDQMYIVSQYIRRHDFVYKKQIDNIVNLIDSPNTISNYQTLLLFHWCSIVMDCLPLERVELGETLWLILTTCDFKMSTAHYNALLKLYVENEYDFAPMKLLMDMKSNGIDPDAITYEACITYCCRKGNINEALILVEDMKKLRLPVAESIFNSLIVGYSRSGDMQTINNTVRIMKEGKIKLTTETYAAVMCTYAKLNRIHKIREIIEECNLKNIHFTNKDILNVIYTLAVNNYTKDINTMYQYLKQKACVSNTEIQIILKLTSISEMHVAVTALSHICFNEKFSQFNNIMKLMLKHMIDKRKMVHEITKLCTVPKSEHTFNSYLLISLHYSLLKGSSLCLPLLRISKHHYTIKPHFFWPLLIKEANKYDLQGILDILKIMVNEFHVSPCIDTVADYVLPFTFGNVQYVRNLLMEYKLSETMLNNAYVLFMLKKKRLKEAALYIRTFKDKYYCKVIAHELRHAAIYKNDVHNFVYISCNLVENMDLGSTSKSCDESLKPTSIHMDKQLHDFMIDFPSHKTWLKRVLKQLIHQNVSLKYETTRMITDFLSECATNDVVNVLQFLSNKDT